MPCVAAKIGKPSDSLRDGWCVIRHVLGALRVPALHEDDCLDLMLAFSGALTVIHFAAGE